MLLNYKIGLSLDADKIAEPKEPSYERVIERFWVNDTETDGTNARDIVFSESKSDWGKIYSLFVIDLISGKYQMVELTNPTFVPTGCWVTFGVGEVNIKPDKFKEM